MSYAHRAHAFWTGFYTSRPGLKLYERSLSTLHQVKENEIMIERMLYVLFFCLSRFDS